MKEITRINAKEIGVSFDFTTDCSFWNDFWTRGNGMGHGKTDPDSTSRTLRQYHQALWSKPLPNGSIFDLEFCKHSEYLRYKDIRFSTTIDDYMRWIEATRDFVKKRNKRINEYLNGD